MPDKIQPTKDAAVASERLREVLDSMRNIWRRSLEEDPPDSPIDLYLVDADVVVMFMAPLMKHNYGALLRYEGHARQDAGSDLKEFEARLVEFLGNLLFFQLRPDIPLLLLPNHANDLERIMDKVGGKALNEMGSWQQIYAEIENSTRNAIKTSKDKLASAEKAVAENGPKEHTIEELLDKIFCSLRGEGATGELFRFDALMSSNRIMHLDHMCMQDKDGQKRYLPPPLTETGGYIPSVSKLADRLNRVMTNCSALDDPSKHFWIRSDAQALAHLAWLNALFSEEQWYVRMGNGSSRRQIRKAVLITGSHLSTRAIRELEIEPLIGCVTTPLSFLGHRMMDEYFRRSIEHKQPTMGEAHQGSQVSALINFFDSMRAVLNSAINTHNPDEITRAVEDVRSQHYKLAEKWQGRQLFGEHSRMNAVTEAITFIEKSGRSLEGLRNFLEELSVTAWQGFARSVTMLSLKSVNNDNVVLRNIPPVRFKRFNVAKNISDKLFCPGDSAKAREIAREILVKSTIEKLKREDPSHYTEFVCYALFGLVHRTLKSAEGCAEVAWSIAQAKPTQGKLAEYIKGDEALYLLAHIIRLRAHHIEYLDRAERYIKLAIEASRQASEVDHIDHIEDIRYSAELFSINCHRRYFECFGLVGRRDQMSRPVKDKNRLRLTFFEGKQLLDRIEESNPEPDEFYIFEYVKQQLLVNLAQIALLWLYPPERMESERVEVYCSFEKDADFEKERKNILLITKKLIDQCQKLDKDETGTMPKPSILATSVAAVSARVFLKRNELAVWFNQHDGKVASVDKLRYMYLQGVYNYCSKDC